jgi:hypothetical protein
MGAQAQLDEKEEQLKVQASQIEALKIAFGEQQKASVDQKKFAEELERKDALLGKCKETIRCAVLPCLFCAISAHEPREELTRKSCKC